MGIEDRIIQSGNKKILHLFWFLYIPLLFVAILSDIVFQLLTVTFSFIFFNLIFLYWNHKGKFLRFIMYSATFSCMLLVFCFNFFRPHMLAYCVIFFGVVVITLFLNHRPLIFSVVLGIFELIFFFFRNHVSDIPYMEAKFLFYFIIVMILYGVVLGTVLRNTEKLRLESEIQKLKVLEDKSELERVLNKTKDNSSKVKHFSLQLQQNLEDTHSSSQLINNSIQEISTAFDNQNESLIEISSNISEIDQNTEYILDTSKNMVSFTQRTLSKSDEGIFEMNELNHKMIKIEKTISDTVTMMNLLESKTEEIMSIIDVLNSISSQTNLLSLNARIEAARVGEAGRGFMVVAEEVKNLADSSTVFTKNIANILLELKSFTKSTVEKTKEGETAITDGKQSVLTVHSSLEDIAHNVKQISDSFCSLEQMIYSLKVTTTGIVSQTTNISSISEENTYSFDEIKNAVYGLELKIEKITSDFKELDDNYLD